MIFFGGSKKQEVEEKAAEIAKLEQMLDNVDNIVMLCDATPDNKIFYQNRRAKEQGAVVCGMHRGLRKFNGDICG